MPHSQLESNDEFCDLASVASLTRNLTEAYQMFYYLSIDNVGHEEAMLRYLLIRLHEKAELEEIFQKFGREDEAQNYAQEKRSLRDKVKNNQFYLQELSSNQASIYKLISEDDKSFYPRLKNKKGRCLSREKINKILLGKIVEESERIDIESGAKKFEALETYFSNHTHTSPLSIAHTIEENGKEDGDKHFFSLCIRHCAFYLGFSIFDMVELFKRDCDELFKPHCFDISENEKNLIGKTIHNYIDSLGILNNNSI